VRTFPAFFDSKELYSRVDLHVDKVGITHSERSSKWALGNLSMAVCYSQFMTLPKLMFISDESTEKPVWQTKVLLHLKIVTQQSLLEERLGSKFVEISSRTVCSSLCIDLKKSILNID
jgi:hypothetical protein